MDLELIVVKRCVWGTFKSDGCYSVRFKDLHSLPKSNAENLDAMLCEKYSIKHSPLNPSQLMLRLLWSP